MNKVELENKITELEAVIKEKDTMIQELQTPESSILTDRINELEAEVETNNVVIEEMTQELENVNGKSSKSDELVIDGKTYEVITPNVNIKGKVFKTAKLDANPEIVKQILKMEGQNIIKAITK